MSHRLSALAAVLVAGLVALPACNKKDGAPGGQGGIGYRKTDRDAFYGSQNKLKQIGLALHAFCDSTGYLPHNIVGPDGKTPGLSWRVAILPYIEQQHLYTRFRLNEPWDSEHNRALVAEMPKTYAPAKLDDYNGYTFYQSFAGRGAFLPPARQAFAPGTPIRGLRFPDISDGLANTLAVAEAAEAVIWTKPDDIPFDADGPPPKLGGVFREGANVLFADGSVRFFDADLPPATLKATITIGGGEVVSLP